MSSHAEKNNVRVIAISCIALIIVCMFCIPLLERSRLLQAFHMTLREENTVEVIRDLPSGKNWGIRFIGRYPTELRDFRKWEYTLAEKRQLPLRMLYQSHGLDKRVYQGTIEIYFQIPLADDDMPKGAIIVSLQDQTLPKSAMFSMVLVDSQDSLKGYKLVPKFKPQKGTK